MPPQTTTTSTSHNSPPILQALAISALFSIPLIILSQLASFLSPQTLLTAIETTYVLLFLAFIFQLFTYAMRIPLSWARDTETWWVLQNVWVPRAREGVLGYYRRAMTVRGWVLFGTAAVGLVWFSRLGLEMDLFCVVVAHWVAVLAALARQEEWDEGGRFLVGNWREGLEALGVLFLIRTYWV